MSQINLELNLRPKTIKPSYGGYEVSLYLDDQFLTVIPMCYNDYTEAECAARKYIMEKFK